MEQALEDPFAALDSDALLRRWLSLLDRDLSAALIDDPARCFFLFKKISPCKICDG